MKNLKFFALTGAFCIIMVFGISEAKAQAQEKTPNWELTGAISHGNKAEAFGVHLRPTYKLFDRLHAAPSVTFFFPSEPATFLKRNVTSWNIDGVYMLQSDDSLFEPYVIGGLNFTRQKLTFDNSGSDETSKRTRRGVNIGAGANLRLLKRFAPFAEARYAIGGYMQFEIMAGVKI